jgi:hypothetical protein
MYSQFMGRDPRIDKLSDEFGQYLILLKCECGHERTSDAATRTRSRPSRGGMRASKTSSAG